MMYLKLIGIIPIVISITYGLLKIMEWIVL